MRYSQLAKVPEGMLNFVKMQFPQVGFRLVRLLGHYYSGRMASSYITHHNVPDPMTQKVCQNQILLIIRTLESPYYSRISGIY